MKRIKKRAGVTLVELIVTFALIALFVTAAAGLIPPMLKIYSRVQYEDHAQSVADAILQSLRAELQTANGRNGEEGASYIKLRTSNGETVALDTANDMTGSTIEFVCTAHVEDEMDILLFAEQIDCKGLSASPTHAGATQAVLYQKNSGTPDDALHNYVEMGIDELVPGYPVMRYYTADSSKLYQDEFDSRPRFYNAQMMYATRSYMNHTVELNFVIPPEALVTDGGETFVRFVRVEVKLTHASGRTYTTTGAVKLSNEPQYTEDPTMISD